MADIHNLTLWVLTLFTTAAHCQAYTTGLHSEFKVIEKSTSTLQVPCPDPQVISPCGCTLTPWNPNVDCSDVESEDELRTIFNKPFEYKSVHTFMIQRNTDLRVLSEGIFGEITFQLLFLYNGALEIVEPNTLNGSYGTLKDINISLQNLTSFPFEEIVHFSRLNALSLTNNRLSSFPTIKSMSLTILDLTSNPIRSIPKEALQNIPQLYSFTCSECGLTEIFPGTFTGLNGLATVTLRDNDLTYIPENTIDIQYYRAGILLDGNKLSNISEGAITAKNKDSVHIDIMRNNLTKLEEQIWRPHFENELQFLRAEDNPIACECDVAWLVLNPDLMAKLGGKETCQDGRLLSTLDPAYYEEMC